MSKRKLIPIAITLAALLAVILFAVSLASRRSCPTSALGAPLPTLKSSQSLLLTVETF